jgi:hypothetical protein
MAYRETTGSLVAESVLPPGTRVSQPHDPAEREAERVADDIMRHPGDGAATTRAPAAVVARSADASDGASSGALSGSSDGSPLPSSDRAFMEQRFGRSFGAVRIHADDGASRVAHAISARAFTVGTHVFFRQDAYAPGTFAGRRLLAHELAHVVQGGGAGELRRYDETTEAASRGWEIASGVGESLGGLPVIVARRLRAASCLRPLFRPMHDITFGRWIPHACGRSTSGQLHAREWDAFGHCWIACEGARRCGAAPTADLGLAREIQREVGSWLGGEPHDSFWQDVGNQARGRGLAFQGGTCFSLCDTAHRTGGLDLSAPIRTCVNCADPTGPEGPCILGRAVAPPPRRTGHAVARGP